MTILDDLNFESWKREVAKKQITGEFCPNLIPKKISDLYPAHTPPNSGVYYFRGNIEGEGQCSLYNKYKDTETEKWWYMSPPSFGRCEGFGHYRQCPIYNKECGVVECNQPR